ncbi:MAG: sugar ABC transporter ATP-binding protein, partial [Lentisphaerota bacterium]
MTRVQSPPPADAEATDSRPLLEMIGISKSFPGVQAVRSATLELLAGEIHALVGENGAGKSTLIKILTGVHRRDTGELRLNGRPVDFRHPLDAQRAGIAAIYQEFTLVPSLSVTANVLLGHELTRRGLLDQRRERRLTARILTRLGAEIDPTALVAELTVANQQIVEIARALAREASLLVMDEPTAALTPQEVARLFDVLHELTERGMGIIFISHRLDEVAAIARRITVMRDGATIITRRTDELPRRRLIEFMVGRPLEQEYPKSTARPGDTLLEVRGLCGGFVQNVDFTVRAGEVLGLAGLLGAGRTETARLIFGADRREAGDILLSGRLVAIASPHAAIAAGIGLLTEDRKAQGLLLNATAQANFALPNLSSWSRWGWINRRREQARFAARVAGLNIRLAHSEQPAEELSGGNQQKLLVARWLETDSRVIIF